MSKGSTAAVIHPELLWAGTEHSLLASLEARGRMLAGGPFGAKDDEDDQPHMLSIQDGIGVVSIRGPLVNDDHPANRLFGISSYADIRRAVMAAADNPEIKGILLDIHSGGGAVSGVVDTATLISTVDRNVKPVWAFTDGMMASAAYWLGSSARHVSASSTSVVGSVGVISTHMEFSKALKEDGVGVTVMRAGEYKALANRYEPLTERAQAQLQAQLDGAYGVFINHVAAARGVTVDQADKRMGQGREFFGEEAVSAGLVDSIQSFDQVFGAFSSKLLDTQTMTQNNYEKYHKGLGMTRKALTEQQIAAAASGAVNAAAAPNAPSVEENTSGTEAVATATTEATAAQPAPAEASVSSTATSSELVSYLQTQVDSLQAQAVDLRVELAGAQAQVKAMQSHFDALVAIAGRSVSNMRIALGSPAVDTTKMSTDSLLAEHAALTESFNKSFRAGGVAAVNAPATEAQKPAMNDALRKARLAATKAL